MNQIRTILSQVAYSFDLLLERRLWLYVIGDFFLLFLGVLQAIGSMKGDDWLEKLYPQLVIMPNLILGLPALASVVALERRVGSLDLALAVPSTQRYFIRRVAPVCAVLMVQSWIVLALAADGWELLRAVIQGSVLTLFLGALALFWASRLKTSGAVLAASLVSVAAMSRWIFTNPVTTPTLGVPADLFGITLPNLAWCWDVTVMLLATTILYLYARERLRHPEAMLA